ncbi:hypothetical protein AJ79_08345 [Helicocarpus griseus UAMH5409]|uniref:YMC020W-like alpha/beta hydrolase domain-containing protein n=1 Tax=Helicocarpus griseus UAMH5409 TaxID=1447875 RepID=A0A2B7WKT6_9EURO|nr:hypothetical protein AJ79_08345 [Helicocarpus griseus UAMH5409]
MAPAEPRKRVKSNIPSDSEQAHAPNDGNMSPDASAEARSSDKQKENDSSWYTRTWPRKPKAPAVTEVARESISAEGVRTPERKLSTTTISNHSRPVRSPSISLTKKVGGSTRSLPAEVATTRINVASIGSPSVVADMPISDKKAEDDKKDNTEEGSSSALPNDSAKSLNDPEVKELDDKATQDAAPGNHVNGEEKQEEQQLNQSSSWFGWLPLPRGTNESAAKTHEIQQPNDVAQVSKPREEEPQVKEEMEQTRQMDSGNDAVEPNSNPTAQEAPTSTKRSWLQMWSGYSTPPQQSQQSQQPEDTRNDARIQEVVESAGGQDSSVKTDTTEHAVESTEPQISKDGGSSNAAAATTTKSSSWLFWSRETLADPVEQTAKQPELAKDKTSSASHDQAFASIKVSKPESGPVATESQDKRAPAEDVASDTSSKLSTKKTTAPPKDKSPSASSAKIAFPNQVLPLFKGSFPVKERPGLIQQLGRLLYYSKGSGPSHVTLTPDPPRVKRALAIGVHGYFPAPLIRTVLGQPTGTSVKFSTGAAKAIQSWAESHGFPCEIQKIALEGEGRISERVDLLWKLLLDYIEDIKKADFIMVACHSQGVPVATMLVAKLIAFGCVSSARIGICAMAGVNLGPFPDFRSRWISGSAGELFDFANPKSKVSQDNIAALEVTLDFGVRIVYVGSIDDQLVSLESSIFAPVCHPHIYRAVFVDGRVHAPSFLSQLVGFAMKLRNLGISDHGLIRELSSPLAGSLYTGEGHSRLYDEEAVYSLAVEYALETIPVPTAKLEVNNSNRSSTPNPYILPFAMRGVLEEEYVRRELNKETAELLQLFDDWKPTSKVLKDVKFRLEGIRSKL